MGLSNISVTLLCDSDEGLTPVNSDQVLSDEDLPPTACSEDSRQVVRISDVSRDVQIVDVSQVGREWDSRRTVWGAGHPRFESGKRTPLPVCIPATAMSGWAKMAVCLTCRKFRQDYSRISKFRSVPGGWNG